MHVTNHSGFRSRQVLADLGRAASAGVPGNPSAAAARVLIGAITGTETHDADWQWARRGRKFRDTPAAVRAALMNGVEHLRILGRLSDACPPTPEDLATTARADLELVLTALARTMTASEIDHIARADFGAESERNRAALTALLEDAALPYPDASGFPSRVVGLVADSPSQPGYVPCLAITLLHAVRDGDAGGAAAQRLEAQFADISRLRAAVRDVLFGAFRHLYEVNRQWEPDLPTVFTLPWTDAG